MKNVNRARRGREAVRDRASRLSAAILRVSASLDLDTVLQEIVDSARDLTGARYGAITTIDASRQPQDFFTSGFTPEEHRQLLALPDRLQLFAHFRDLPGTVRLADLPAYVRSLGHTARLTLFRTLQGTPLRHRGEHIGNFYLADKEDGHEFTDEDEEVLLLFASQAATAIANARTHRDEQRARAGLEALVDTSPVGVAVFDARTGKPMLFNREAKRIVEKLGVPASPYEELLRAVTCLRADGSELALGEFPLAALFSDAETVRAEEIVLRVADGRGIRTLLNTTPIRSREGELERVVVTLQDLTPLEELERLRAQFLGMVSHELRAPLTSIKGSTATVLGAAPVPNVTEMLQFFRIVDQQADHMSGLIGNLLDVGRIEAGTLSVAPESTEVSSLVEQARNTFLSGGSRHTILIDHPAGLPRVMADRQRIVQVLSNLLSNAARHSPESSPIRISAEREGVHVAVSVSDEGSGVAPEKLPRLFQKYTGLGEGQGDPALRGSGLGLAICKGLVEAHGGRIWAASGGVDQGLRVTFTVPVAEEAGDAPGDRRGRQTSPSTTPSERREPVPILVVDDDPQTLRYVRDALTMAGFSPVTTGDHRELSRIIRAERPHLVLLDLLLPGGDGIELMENVSELADLPVIFISGYGRDETIARALEAGAADYVVKPFSPTELTARIRAALRRRADPEPFVLGDLTIHYEERRVAVAGRPVQLTATEYDLLRVLSLNAGRVSTYDALIRQVWGGQDSGDPELVRTFVKKLRHKLGDSAARPAYIFNERGVGYRMSNPGA